MHLLICPLDFRYGREKMRSLFSEEGKLRLMLKVEAALASSEASAGLIPESAARSIQKAVTENRVRTERVKEIERETGHDVMAMVLALSEAAGEGGKYVHYAATSNDIIDTAVALQLRTAVAEIRKDMIRLERILASMAMRERETIMLGRTHGQAALPMTFGLKLTVYLSEIDRHLDRLAECEKRVVVGKMSGAIGTGASMGNKFFSIQREMRRRLGISLEDASGQIVGRDRYAELISVLSLITTTCEKMATEVRNLQRSEIDEVEEHFDERRQVGSSTMAQKKNPVLAENICGLARVVRAFTVPSYENMILWHERDLTNSSAERITLSHACVLADDILNKTATLFKGLKIKKNNMKRNLRNFESIIMAERVMLSLTDSLGRQQAHEAVRKAAMRTADGKMDFENSLLSDPAVAGALDRITLRKLLDASTYTGHASEITADVVRRVSAKRRLGIRTGAHRSAEA